MRHDVYPKPCSGGAESFTIQVFSLFYGTPRFITGFTKVCLVGGGNTSQMSAFHTLQGTYYTLFLILFLHQYHDLQNTFFIFYIFIYIYVCEIWGKFSPLNLAIYPIYHILFDWYKLIGFGEF